MCWSWTNHTSILNNYHSGTEENSSILDKKMKIICYGTSILLDLFHTFQKNILMWNTPVMVGWIPNTNFFKLCLMSPQNSLLSISNSPALLTNWFLTCRTQIWGKITTEFSRLVAIYNIKKQIMPSLEFKTKSWLCENCYKKGLKVKKLYISS